MEAASPAPSMIDGVFLGNFDALGLAQILQDSFFQRQTGFFSDDGTAGQDGDIFEHGLATIAKARGLDGNGLQDATDVVNNQGSQCFAIDIFGDDEQRAAGLGNLLKNRQQVTDVGNLLVVEQDERVFHQRLLLVAVVDEVRGQVATVKLHAFNDIQLVSQGFAIFNGDDAFLADFFHRIGDDLADIGIRVGRNGANLSDFLGRGARLGERPSARRW